MFNFKYFPFSTFELKFKVTMISYYRKIDTHTLSLSFFFYIYIKKNSKPYLYLFLSLKSLNSFDFQDYNSKVICDSLFHKRKLKMHIRYKITSSILQGSSGLLKMIHGISAYLHLIAIREGYDTKLLRYVNFILILSVSMRHESDGKFRSSSYDKIFRIIDS